MKRILLLSALWIAAVAAFAQNPVVPFRSPRATFLTQTGQPLSGGCVFTYQGGTTTPQYTYADSGGYTPNPNPVPLDTTGSAVMWFGVNTYKLVAYSNGGVNCASGSLQWTVDNIPGDSFLNGTISGATITNPTITGGTESGTALSGVAIVTSSIDSTGIGGTTRASGDFTSLATGYEALSFSTTPVFDASTYGIFSMTLTADVTSSTITGGASGQTISFQICQGGSSGYTFAWPSNLQNPPAVNPSDSACTSLSAFYNGFTWVTEESTITLLNGGYSGLTFSATPVFNAAAYSSLALTLTGNVTSSTITGGTSGQILNLYICQDGTGGRTLAWPTTLFNAPTISSPANACTGLSAVSNGSVWNTIATTAPASSTVGSQTTALASAFTTAATSLTSTGLVLPSIPAGATVRGFCNLAWQQSTSAAAVVFGIGLSTTPGNMFVFAEGQIGSTTTFTSITNTTPVSVGSISTGSSATLYTQRLNFTLTAGTSAEVVTIYGNTSNASDALTVSQGSSCGWLP